MPAMARRQALTGDRQLRLGFKSLFLADHAGRRSKVEDILGFKHQAEVGYILLVLQGDRPRFRQGLVYLLRLEGIALEIGIKFLGKQLELVVGILRGEGSAVVNFGLHFLKARRQIDI